MPAHKFVRICRRTERRSVQRARVGGGAFRNDLSAAQTPGILLRIRPETRLDRRNIRSDKLSTRALRGMLDVATYTAAGRYRVPDEYWNVFVSGHIMCVYKPRGLSNWHALSTIIISWAIKFATGLACGNVIISLIFLDETKYDGGFTKFILETFSIHPSNERRISRVCRRFPKHQNFLRRVLTVLHSVQW